MNRNPLNKMSLDTDNIVLRRVFAFDSNNQQVPNNYVLAVSNSEAKWVDALRNIEAYGTAAGYLPDTITDISERIIDLSNFFMNNLSNEAGQLGFLQTASFNAFSNSVCNDISNINFHIDASFNQLNTRIGDIIGGTVFVNDLCNLDASLTQKINDVSNSSVSQIRFNSLSNYAVDVSNNLQLLSNYTANNINSLNALKVSCNDFNEMLNSINDVSGSVQNVYVYTYGTRLLLSNNINDLSNAISAYESNINQVVADLSGRIVNESGVTSIQFNSLVSSVNSSNSYFDGQINNIKTYVSNVGPLSSVQPINKTIFTKDIGTSASGSIISLLSLSSNISTLESSAINAATASNISSNIVSNIFGNIQINGSDNEVEFSRGLSSSSDIFAGSVSLRRVNSNVMDLQTSVSNLQASGVDYSAVSNIASNIVSNVFGVNEMNNGVEIPITKTFFTSADVVAGNASLRTLNSNVLDLQSTVSNLQESGVDYSVVSNISSNSASNVISNIFGTFTDNGSDVVFNKNLGYKDNTNVVTTFSSIKDSIASLNSNQNIANFYTSNSSLILKGNSSSINPTNANSMYIKSLRDASANKVLFYDPSTGEVTYNEAPTGGGSGSGLPVATAESSYVYYSVADAQWKVGSNAIRIGYNSGVTDQSIGGIAIGFAAGNTSQSLYSVAIGGAAGSSNQDAYAVAIGYEAGKTSQLQNAVAIGGSAGASNQGAYSVAIGDSAGNTSQGNGSVAIGTSAGETNQGSGSIAIGALAGYIGQHSNTIIFNATNAEFNSSTSNAFYVKPVRNASATQMLYYDVTSGEISYSNIPQTTSALPSATDSSSYLYYNGIGWIVGTDRVRLGSGSGAGAVPQLERSVCIGFNAGQSGQNKYCVAIGNHSAQCNQQVSAVAIGSEAGRYDQCNYSIAIGDNAGNFNQNSNAIAIGFRAGYQTQFQNGIAIGYEAGNSIQRQYAIAIGDSAAYFGQRSNSVAIGHSAAYSNQGINSIAIGMEAGYIDQSSNAIAIGRSAGKIKQGMNSIAIGDGAGDGGGVDGDEQQSNAIAIGSYAGRNRQLVGSIAIGHTAGQLGQGSNSIAIGFQSATYGQGINSIALGNNITTGIGASLHSNTIVINATGVGLNSSNPNAFYVKPVRNASATQMLYYDVTSGEISYSNAPSTGSSLPTTSTTGAYLYYSGSAWTVGTDNIRLGTNAGQSSQLVNSVAIGYQSGQSNQNSNAVAIGYQAGRSSQQTKSIAIGLNAANINQKSNAIAIGDSAGFTSQGIHSIAIGTNAGYDFQSNNTIILNATGANLNAATSNAFYVKPVREVNSASSNIELMYYNKSTGEITYNTNGINIQNNSNLTNDLQMLNLENISGGNTITLINAQISTASGNPYEIQIGGDMTSTTTVRGGIRIARNNDINYAVHYIQPFTTRTSGSSAELHFSAYGTSVGSKGVAFNLKDGKYGFNTETLTETVNIAGSLSVSTNILTPKMTSSATPRFYFYTAPDVGLFAGGVRGWPLGKKVENLSGVRGTDNALIEDISIDGSPFTKAAWNCPVSGLWQVTLRMPTESITSSDMAVGNYTKLTPICINDSSAVVFIEAGNKLVTTGNRTNITYNTKSSSLGIGFLSMLLLMEFSLPAGQSIPIGYN